MTVTYHSIAESHRRQFNGEDYQAVAQDLCDQMNNPTMQDYQDNLLRSYPASLPRLEYPPRLSRQRRQLSRAERTGNTDSSTSREDRPVEPGSEAVVSIQRGVSPGGEGG